MLYNHSEIHSDFSRPLTFYLRYTILLWYVAWNAQTVYAQDIPDSLYTNANAIVISEMQVINLLDYNKYTQSYYNKTKVLNKKAEGHLTVRIPYKKGSEKISDIKINIIDEDGNVILSPKSKELKDHASWDGYSIITDYRAIEWSCNTGSYPITVEYSYTKESKNTLVLPVWSPIRSYAVAILESSYKIVSSQDIRQKNNNFDNYKSIETRSDGLVMRNQKAIKKEKFTLPTTQIFPAQINCPVEFQFENSDGRITDWQDYGKWIYDSFLKDNTFKNAEEVKADLDKVISPNDSAEQICRKVYKYIQDHTRYISVSIADGGLCPMNPSDVHELKYGDCKALSFYMKSILDLYNIRSHYVEVAANANATVSMYEDFACPFPGNHIIVNVPLESDTFWIDCTSEYNQFGFLGSFTDNRLVLEISENAGNLVSTPEYSHGENYGRDSIAIVVGDNNVVEGNMVSNLYGPLSTAYHRLHPRSEQGRKDWIKEHLLTGDFIEKLEIGDIGKDEREPKSKIIMSFGSSRFLETAGDYCFIPKVLSNIGIPRLPKDGKRDQRIYFVRDRLQEQIITIEFSTKIELLEVEDYLHESEYGSYACNVSIVDQRIIKIEKFFKLNRGTYEPESYSEIKLFFDKCLKKDTNPITIKR